MTMGSDNKRAVDELHSILIAALGSCTPQRMEDILKVTESREHETAIVAACMMICSLDDSRPLNNSFWQQPLDALVSCNHPAAEAALLNMAQHAQNGRIQVEAAHGCSRTKDTILEIHDAMAEATRTGRPYRTRLDPPPGPPADEHGNFLPLPEWKPGQPRPANWPPHIHAPKHALTAKDGAVPERRRSKS